MAKEPTKKEHLNIDQSRPFLGLRSFEEKNKSQFGGRDGEINKLFSLVEDNNLTVVFGTSGIGKTSLLKAGLMPKLRQKFYFPIYIRIDYSSSKPPLLQLKGLVYEEMKDMDANIKAIGTRSLWEYLHDVNFLNGLATPVLILDQFEEIFTLGKHNKGIKHFVTELSDLAQNRIPTAIKDKYLKQGKTVPSRYNKQSYRVVISLREDYLAQLDELKRFIPAIMDHGFRITQMTIAQAMEAAIKPGKGLIDVTVAKAIIKILPGISQADFDLMQSKGDDNKKLKVEPFLLSLICDQLNEKRIEMRLNTITLDLVAQFKVDDVIKSFYNDTIKKYDSNVDKAIQNELLNSEGYRKLHATKEFQNDYHISDDVVDALVDARIIRNENRNNVDYLELIHDVLAPIIKKKRDDRLKAEHEAKRKAEIAEQEAKREAERQLEKEKIKRRNKLIFAAAIPIALFIAVTAIMSTRKVYINNKRVEKMVLSRNLLSNAASVSNYSGNHIKAMLLSRTAYKIFAEAKLEGAGENMFDNLYYYRMLFSLKKYLSQNGTIEEQGAFLEISNRIKENENANININSNVFNSVQSKEQHALKPGPVTPVMPITTPTPIGNKAVVTISVDDEAKSGQNKGNTKQFEFNPPFRKMILAGPKEHYYLGLGDGNFKILNKNDNKTYSVVPTKDSISMPTFITSIAYDDANGILAMADIKSNFIKIYDLNKQVNKLTEIPLEPLDRFGKDDQYLTFKQNGDLLVLRTKDSSLSMLDQKLKEPQIWKKADRQEIWKWIDSTRSWDKPIEIKQDNYVIWNKKSLRIRKSLGDLVGNKLKALKCISVSKDSKIAIGLQGGIIILTKNEYLEIEDAQLGDTRVIKFDSDGEYLVVGNEKGEVYSFKIKEINGQIKTIEKYKHFEHNTRITDIAFRPKDNLHKNTVFATSDVTGLVVIWEKVNNQEKAMDEGKSNDWSSLKLDVNVVRLEEKKDRISGDPSISFDQTGDNIIVSYGDENRTIYKWPVSLEGIANLICEKIIEERNKLDKDSDIAKKINDNFEKKLDSINSILSGKIKDSIRRTTEISLNGIKGQIEINKHRIEENNKKKLDLGYDETDLIKYNLLNLDKKIYFDCDKN